MKSKGATDDGQPRQNVPYRELGSVGSLFRGLRFVKADIVASGVPCMHYGEIYTHYGLAADQSISFLTEERARTMRFAHPGDVIIASAGETVAEIGKAVAWLGTEPIVIHDACYVFTSELEPRYVSLYFSSRVFRDQIREHVSSSKISTISLQNLAKARIPVPPREMQLKLVETLDRLRLSVDELESDLRKELLARTLQHREYRSRALTSGHEGRSLALGDAIRIRFGTRITKAQHAGDLFPVFGGGGESFRTDRRGLLTFSVTLSVRPRTRLVWS